METMKKLTSRLSKLLTPRASVRQKVTVPIYGGIGSFVSFKNLVDQGEHVAVVFETPIMATKSTTPLVRVHSECLTGDVFFSGKCDCGEQLKEAVTTLQRQGGILVYLRQEGRGIGLYNKLDAYALQGQGYDTYESNRMLGFDNDLRNYEVAAQMLAALGHSKIRLLSNNPDKANQLEESGIKVDELVSTGVFVKKANKEYLKAKVRVTGHRIHLEEALL